jgi:hypothetical protein
MPTISNGRSTVNGYVPTGLSTAQVQALSPSQVITMSNLQNSYSYPSSIFGEEKSAYGSHIKKYSIFESTEDLLVLACTWRRLREGNASLATGMKNMLDHQLLEFISPEDRQEAIDIQDYYSKKIMMWKLKGNSLTKYREDLNSLIHSDSKKFREEMIGIAYFLPSFKDYDVGLDDVRCNVNNLPMSKIDKIKTTGKNLTPMKKLVRKTKRMNEIHYWLRTETNHGVMMALDAKNPLLHIWDHLFETKDLLSINATFYAQSRDDFEYFSIKNWKLESI